MELVRYAFTKALLQFIYLGNATNQDMKLEDIINNYVGYHPINARLQKELRVGLRQCHRCNFHCVIETGEFGRCHSVANAGNTLVSVNYGLIAAIATSIIDSWGFFHFRAGSSVLALSSLYCNFRCDFCCNARLTHIKNTHSTLLDALVKQRLKPDEVVQIAQEEKVSGIVFGIAEATMNLEFILDVASLARQYGLFVAIQTNGYMTPETIKLLARNIDAVIIGMKGFDDTVYRKRLLEHDVKYEYVLDSIKEFHKHGVHTEVSALVSKSGSIKTSARQTAKWLATNVSPEIPIDIFALRETVHDSLSCDESDAVARIQSICRDSGLINIYNHESQNNLTYCPNCDKIVVERKRRENASNGGVLLSEYDVRYVGLNVVEDKGYCANCGSAIYGVWK